MVKDTIRMEDQGNNLSNNKLQRMRNMILRSIYQLNQNQICSSIMRIVKRK